jgi:hypothetical protein
VVKSVTWSEVNDESKSKEISLGDVKCVVGRHGTVEMPMASIPSISISQLPKGIKYSVSNNLSTITIDPGATKNVCIVGSTDVALCASDVSHGLLRRIYHESICMQYRRNPTVQVINDLPGQNNLFPGIIAKIEAEMLKELFDAAHDLATALLFPVTEIARNMSRHCACVGEQTGVFN